MSEKFLKKILKEIFVVALIVIAAVGIELVIFNFHSFVKRESVDLLYEKDQDLPEGIKKVGKRKNGIRIILKQPTYIQKVQLQLDVPETLEYKIFTRYNNVFDKEEIGQEIDIYRPELGTGYTNIGEEVKVLSLNLPKNIPWEIESVRLYTKITLNKYRILFFVMVLVFLFSFIRNRNKIYCYLEWFVVFFCLVSGSYVIYNQGIQENGWDEEIHFNIAYQMSFLEKNIIQNDAIRLMQKRVPLTAYNTVEEKELYTVYLNQCYESSNVSEEKEISFQYNRVSHILSSLGIGIGRMLKFPFNKLYMFGKFLNLLWYCFCIFWAIKLMPVRKEVIAAIAMIPTQIFIATTYTYDVNINCCLMLGFILWLKVIVEPRQYQTIFYLWASIFFFGVGALAKAIYIPLLLLCCFVPKEKYASKKQYYCFWIVIVGITIGVLSSFILPTIINTLTDVKGWGGDNRVEGTDVVSQFKSILKHLIEYMMLLSKEIWNKLGEFLIGKESLANFGRLKTANEVFTIWISIWGFAISVFQREGEIFELEKKYKNVILVICITIVFLIWTSMYLSYTAVGRNDIIGVQGRYYAPLLLPIIFIIGSDKVKVNMSKESYVALIMIVPGIIFLSSIYELMIMKSCM